MALSDLLKQLYRNGWDTKMAVKDHPALLMTKTEGDFLGRNYYVPVQTTLSKGGSHTASTAASNTGNIGVSAFTVTAAHDYQYISIDGFDVRRTRLGADKTQFVNLVKQEFDSGLEAIGNRLARALFRNHGGAIGQVASISTNDIVLTNAEDSIFFYPGQVLQMAETDGTSSTVQSGTVTVASISADGLTITCTGAVTSGISAADADDFIFSAGDFGGSFAGLGSWNPVTAGSLFGVTQSDNRNMLAGLYYDSLTAGDNMETFAIQAEKVLKRHVAAGLKGGMVYMNPTDAAKLKIAKEGLRWIEMKSPTYKLGIEAFETSLGFKVIEDQFCPVGYAFFVPKEGFILHTTGNQPTIWKEGGQELQIKDDGSDKAVAQVLVDGNFIAHRPMAHMRVRLPAA